MCRNCIRSGSDAGCGRPSRRLLDKRRGRLRCASSGSGQGEGRRGRIDEQAPQTQGGCRLELPGQGRALQDASTRSPMPALHQGCGTGRYRQLTQKPNGVEASLVSLCRLLCNLLKQETLVNRRTAVLQATQSINSSDACDRLL